jgi:hypothetical protein
MQDEEFPKLRPAIYSKKEIDSDYVTLESDIVNGYDGFGGVHDNLIWNPTSGTMIYTLHNKVIIEMTKTRE